MTDRTRDNVMIELGRTSAEKRKAAEAQEFDRAADLRGQELALQRELHALGGPPPGMYRIRVDRPDGSHQTVEGPDMEGLAEMCGLIVVSRECMDILAAANRLAERIRPRVRIEFREGTALGEQASKDA